MPRLSKAKVLLALSSTREEPLGALNLALPTFSVMRAPVTTTPKQTITSAGSKIPGVLTPKTPTSTLQTIVATAPVYKVATVPKVPTTPRAPTVSPEDLKKIIATAPVYKVATAPKKPTISPEEFKKRIEATAQLYKKVITPVATKPSSSTTTTREVAPTTATATTTAPATVTVRPVYTTGTAYKTPSPRRRSVIPTVPEMETPSATEPPAVTTPKKVPPLLIGGIAVIAVALLVLTR